MPVAGMIGANKLAFLKGHSKTTIRIKTSSHVRFLFLFDVGEVEESASLTS
jgi:hypothetical protein